MSWIRLDCACLDDSFIIEELTGDEFKAWCLFLLRVKAVGAKGSVPIASTSMLGRNWGVKGKTVASMISKAGSRIVVKDGRWYVKNWRKYQEDYRNKSAYPEIPGDDTDATTSTPPLPLPHKPAFDFETLWIRYPRRLGRREAERHFRSSVRSDQNWQDINCALDNYLKTDNVINKTKFIQHGSTWFNNWRDWVSVDNPVTTILEPASKKRWTCKCGAEMPENQRYSHEGTDRCKLFRGKENE